MSVAERNGGTGRITADLTSFGPARRTAAAIAALPADAELPRYHHKWDRALRTYMRSDLELPDHIDVRGSFVSDSAPVVSVGGSRSPAVEAFVLASAVCCELAKSGAGIVSGGVPGIDLAGHLGAMEGGGGTLGVLANPVEFGLRGHEWPSELVEAAMLTSGGFASEYSSFTTIWGEEFKARLLARDRLISGLCDVFVAFECSEGSATVDTAHRSLLQGKKIVTVMARKRTSRRGLNEIVQRGQAALVLEEGVHTPAAMAIEILKIANAARAQ